ncbi:hypothetical protein SDC9_121103 [bioreactor metagenome]|uniref:Uncharacterized protein n=1 Tax=bioreactor metagenome TaxID=1076179 RepID=A0A645CB44_9ZZZZ
MLFRCAFEYHGSMAEDGNLVREVLYLLKLVADEDDGELAAHPLQQYDQLISLLGGECAGGLIKDEEACTEAEGFHQLDPLLLANGELPDIRVGINKEPVFFRYFIDALANHTQVQLDRRPSLLVAECNVLQHGHIGNQHILLVDHAQSCVKGVVGGFEVNFLPVDEDPSFIWLVETHQDVHQGCLSSTVLANQSQDFSLFYGEGDVITGKHSGKALGDVLHPEAGNLLMCDFHGGILRTKSKKIQSCRICPA